MLAEYEGKHESVHETEGVQDPAVHPDLVACWLLGDEILGPLYPTLHGYTLHQLTERLVSPRKHSNRPLHAPAQLIRYANLLVAYDASSIRFSV